ncbi:MAG: glutamate racemase [Gammaproteobacteria bacterium RIFCSPHIGHO2_12_FULL_45_9]|nr:MAG: glutamate racemase [Gammaproteobacteria bacterium RIFCSPHIGHO2_12_FULL_45_9]
MIGVYDSGYGGLTVLGALRRALPDADFIYLGDSGRAPYGGRDSEVILDFAEQSVACLFAAGCRVIIVACHTVSSVALRHLQRYFVHPDDPSRRILGVTIPAAELAVSASEGHIGFIATSRTVSSGTFSVEVQKLSHHRVTEYAAPLLASIVEEGWEDTPVADEAVARYIARFGDIDTLVLGCTHYPLLRRAFLAKLPSHITLLDPASFVAARLADWLARHPNFADELHGSGQLRMLCTGDPEVFSQHGTRFLGSSLPFVEYISERGGHLVFSEPPHPGSGQLVRLTGLEGTDFSD